MQIGEPQIIRISAVLSNNGAFGKTQTVGYFGFMGFPIGNRHKCRQITGMIQQGVEFDRRLGSTKGCPGKDVQGKVDDGGIQAIEFVFEPEFFDYIDGDSTVLEKEPLEKLSADGQLKAFHHEDFWQSMDTVRDKKILEDIWSTGDISWLKRN